MPTVYSPIKRGNKFYVIRNSDVLGSAEYGPFNTKVDANSNASAAVTALVASDGTTLKLENVYATQLP